MSNHETNLPKDKYTGMREMNFALTPNVMICGVAGVALGAILAYWLTSDMPIIVAAAIVFGILSGIFGMFV